MKIDRVDIVHDVGRSLNPVIDIGQIEGGYVQGMGWLTTEELVFRQATVGCSPTPRRPTRSPDRVRHARGISRSRSGMAQTARTPSIAPRRWASRR